MRSGSATVTLREGGGAVDARVATDVVSRTRVEARTVVPGLVPGASHHIVNVLAPLVVVGCRLADSDAELGGRDERGPLLDVDIGESRRKDESTNWVPLTRRAVRVELSSFITSSDVDLGEVSVARDLIVGRRLDKVSVGDGARRHNPRAVSVGRAVGNLDGLGSSDLACGGRSPEAEVVNGVDIDVLTV